VRRTSWFLRFRRIWSVKLTCKHNFTNMWLMCIPSWGNWVCFHSVDSIAIVVLKLWNDRRTLSKMVFKTGYLENLLWIVWYDYQKMYEWLIGVEYDVVIVWYTFLFTWIMRNCMKLLICGDVVDIDVNVDNGHDYVLVLIIVTAWFFVILFLINLCVFLYAYMWLFTLWCIFSSLVIRRVFWSFGE